MPKYGFNATITYREDLNEELFIIRVRLKEGELPEFIPGQYAELALPPLDADLTSDEHVRWIRRAYSIASPPKASEYLEFLIVKVEGGALTPRLWKMQVGEELWLGPLFKGKFTLDGIPRGIDLVMLSTGTGIAPFVSMLMEYEGTGRWANLAFINGCRFAIDLAYKDFLEGVEKTNPRFKFLPAVTREPADGPWKGLRGRLPGLYDEGMLEEALGYKLDPQRCHVFLCGNPAMIEHMTELLQKRGFTAPARNVEPNIHFERYW
jgi:ferredoxin--NADP+ reductase